MLRRAGGDWYGEADLWVQVPDAPSARQDDGSYDLKHAWVTLDERGRSTSRKGPPEYDAVRLDKPESARASTGGFATASHLSWWPTVFHYPSPGCWAETGTMDGTRVRIVVQVY